jgi:hypothetical protein
MDPDVGHDTPRSMTRAQSQLPIDGCAAGTHTRPTGVHAGSPTNNDEKGDDATKMLTHAYKHETLTVHACRYDQRAPGACVDARRARLALLQLWTRVFRIVTAPRETLARQQVFVVRARARQHVARAPPCTAPPQARTRAAAPPRSLAPPDSQAGGTERALICLLRCCDVVTSVCRRKARQRCCAWAAA